LVSGLGSGFDAVLSQISALMPSPSEHHIKVQRSARYFVVGEPGANTREVWFVLHGYAQLAAQFAGVFEPLSNAERVIVAPEALSRFYLDEPAKRHGPDSPIGAGWMTREDRLNEIDDYVRFLDAVAGEVLGAMKTKPRVVLLGFSQGVATACRWAALGDTRFQRVILWGGALAADMPAERGDQLWYGAQVQLVGGKNDPIVPSTFMDKERKSLVARGVSAELVEFDGGHSLHGETLRRLANG
jgi:predicted esterase